MHDRRPDGALAVLGSTRWRHGMGLRTIATSHDGAVVAGGSEDAWVWRAADGALVARFSSLEGPDATALGFSADDSALAVARGGWLEVWSIVAGARVLREPWRALALVPDGAHGFLAVVAEGGRLSVRRIPDGGEIWGVAAPETTVAALSRDGRCIATHPQNGARGAIDLYDAQGVRRLQGPTTHGWEEDGRDFWGEPTIERREAGAWINALAFDRSGERLVSAGNEPVVRLWDVKSAATLAEVDLGARDGLAVAWSEDGSRVAIAQHPRSKVWDPAGSLVPLGPGRVITFTRDGGEVLVGGDRQVRRCDPDSGARIAEEDDGFGLIGVAIAPEGDVVVCRSTEALTARRTDGTALWRLPVQADGYGTVALSGASGFTARTVPGDQPFAVQRFAMDGGGFAERFPGPVLTFSIAPSPDGRWLAVAGHGSEVAVWDLGTGRRAAKVPCEGPEAVAWARGRLVIASKAGDLLVYPWEGAVAGPAQRLTPTSAAIGRPPNDEARLLAISSDGTHAISSWNDVVRVWDLRAGRQVDGSAAVDKFGKVVAVGFGPEREPRALVVEPTAEEPGRRKGSSLRAWSPRTGFVEITWSPDTLYVYSACGAFFPDGQRFVLAGDDAVFRIHRSA